MATSAGILVPEPHPGITSVTLTEVTMPKLDVEERLRNTSPDSVSTATSHAARPHAANDEWRPPQASSGNFEESEVLRRMAEHEEAAMRDNIRLQGLLNAERKASAGLKASVESLTSQLMEKEVAHRENIREISRMAHEKEDVVFKLVSDRDASAKTLAEKLAASEGEVRRLSGLVRRLDVGLRQCREDAELRQSAAEKEVDNARHRLRSLQQRHDDVLASYMRDMHAYGEVCGELEESLRRANQCLAARRQDCQAAAGLGEVDDAAAIERSLLKEQGEVAVSLGVLLRETERVSRESGHSVESAKAGYDAELQERQKEWYREERALQRQLQESRDEVLGLKRLVETLRNDAVYAVHVPPSAVVGLKEHYSRGAWEGAGESDFDAGHPRNGFGYEDDEGGPGHGRARNGWGYDNESGRGYVSPPDDEVVRPYLTPRESIHHGVRPYVSLRENEMMAGVSPREIHGMANAYASPRENQGARSYPSPRENQGARSYPSPRENQEEAAHTSPRGVHGDEEGFNAGSAAEITSGGRGSVLGNSPDRASRKSWGSRDAGTSAGGARGGGMSETSVRAMMRELDDDDDDDDDDTD